MWFSKFLIEDLGYWDIRMTALSKTLVSLLNLCLTLAYIKIWNPTPQSWIPWNKKCFEDWITYLKVTVPIAFSFYLEGLVFETTTIIASFFPATYEYL